MQDILLSIGGTDNTAGAGPILDLRVWDHLGLSGAVCFTCATAQNYSGIREVHALPSSFFEAQWNALTQDFSPKAVKCSILPTDIKGMEVLKDGLQQLRTVFLLDPITLSGSGNKIQSPAYVLEALDMLQGLVHIVSPNIPELEALGGGAKLQTKAQMLSAARALMERCQIPYLLLKGGHGTGTTVTDLLIGVEEYLEFHSERLPGRFHGTGCMLSAAWMAFWPANKAMELGSLGRALDQARKWTLDQMRQARPHPHTGRMVWRGLGTAH